MEIVRELIRQGRHWLDARPAIRSMVIGLLPVVGLLLVGKMVFWFLQPSDGVRLGFVQGTVSLDGKPLERATVEFSAVGGSPSYGVTDAQGRYRLQYVPQKSGALVGNHVVRITTYDWITNAGGHKQEVPERVPERYNLKSELKAEVRRGSQRLDWQLSSP